MPLEDSGLTLGEVGATAASEQRKEVSRLVHSEIPLRGGSRSRNAGEEATARTQARAMGR